MPDGFDTFQCEARESFSSKFSNKSTLSYAPGVIYIPYNTPTATRLRLACMLSKPLEAMKAPFPPVFLGFSKTRRAFHGRNKVIMESLQGASHMDPSKWDEEGLMFKRK